MPCSCDGSRSARLIAVLVGLGASVSGVEAGAATPSLRLTRVTDLANVTAISARTGTRTLYVTEQSGVVRSIRGGALASTPVVDLTDRVSQDGGERGLLGIAFSPDGTQLYVDYTDRTGNTQIDRVRDARRDADGSSRRTILTVDQPQPNHNGGQLAFGPDGDLYIGLGDGGSEGDVGPGHAPGGNGQSLGTLLGKILRIDPTPTRVTARTRCRPTTRSSAAPARARDLGVRPAQPVAVLLRPRQRRPLDR